MEIKALSFLPKLEYNIMNCIEIGLSSRKFHGAIQKVQNRRTAGKYSLNIQSEDPKFEIRCTHARTNWDPKNAFHGCARVGHM